MQKKLTPGPSSNYEIQFIADSTELETAQKQTIKHFQKEMELPGFRKGNVPLDIVAKNINPQYLQMGIYEEIINTGIQQTLKENPDIKFIGEPYDFNTKQENDQTIITLKLDIYPQVQILDSTRQKEKIDPINIQVSDQEVQDAITSIKKNYADYKDHDTIQLDTVSKIFVEYLDKDSNVSDKSHIYIGEQEFAESKFFEETFINKKKEESFTIPYDTTKLVALLINQKPNLNISQIQFTIKDIKKVVLPELTTENIQKLFGQESQVKTQEQLTQYIQKQIAKQKEDNTLMQNIDIFLQKLQSKYIKVNIPQTLVEEEFKVRLKSFEQRFGGEDKLNQYYTQIGDEKKNEMFQEIKKSSKLSLEKFFILQQVTTDLGIDIDRQKSQNLEVEKKIYEKLSTKEQGSDTTQKIDTKEKKEPKNPKSKTTKTKE